MHKIKTDERKHQDYLRRCGLKVGHIYEGRLYRLRNKEVERVLDLCQDVGNMAQWAGIIENNIDETSYLPKWFQGLFADAGLPMARSTARDMNKAKAAGDEDYWKQQLRKYATTRAGNDIVLVSGTLRKTLIEVLQQEMAANEGIGVEKLAKNIYSKYKNIAQWEVRRIAQTESMIAMADAAHVAAQTLDVGYTKQWCISGLGNTRESHYVMDGVEVDENEPFILAGGVLMYPHDTSLNAAASEIINCACSCIRRPKRDSVRQEPTPTIEPAEEEAMPVLDEQEKLVQAIMKEMPDTLDDAAKRAVALNDIELEKAMKTKKGKPMSVEQADKQSANPKLPDKFIPDPNGNYINRTTGERYTLNPKYRYHRRYETNCVTCSSAYVLRERGFNVTAKGRIKGNMPDRAAREHFVMWKNQDGTPARIKTYTSWMSNKGYMSMTPSTYEEYFKELCTKDGTYLISVEWSNGSCHATILKREKGVISRIEPQYYSEKKGVKQSLSDFCKSGLSLYPNSKVGAMYIDDKVFDKDWVGLFDVGK